MRIDPSMAAARGQAATPARRARRGGTPFGVVEPEADAGRAEEAAASAGPAAPACSTACVAALEQAGAAGPAGGEVADREAASHGAALLSALARLQLARLQLTRLQLASLQLASLGPSLGSSLGPRLGASPGEEGDAARRSLAELARALPSAASPGLDGVLRAIAQRAAIELARAPE